MTKILQSLLSFILFIASITLQAQSLNLINGTQNRCAGTFLDPAGAGNYDNNQNVTGTICAATPEQCLVVTFTSFNLHPGANGTGVDYLYVYDGNSTAAPASSIMTGAAMPGSITSSTGCLTFRFVTDSTNVSSGWSADISCTNCSPDATTPATPSVNAGLDQNICSGQCTMLSATAVSSGGTESYTVVNIPYAPQSFTSGTNQFLGTDDIWGGILNIGFNFCYYGSTYSQIVIGANGCITFNTASSGNYHEWSTETPFPNPLNHTNQICAPYQDMDISVGLDPNRIKFEVIGNAPYRIAKVSWNNVPMYSCNNLLATQQILLYETTNVIETHIANKPTCSWNSGEAIHGIENQNGTIATVVPGRNYPTQWSATNDGKRFIPKGAANYTITWYEGATQIGTGPTLQVCPTATTTYTSRAVYTNCDGSTVTVSDDVTVNITGVLTSPLSVDISGATSICLGTNISLTANSENAVSYQWSNGQTSETIIVSNAGTYTVTATNADACAVTDTHIVAASPSVDISGATSFCSGTNTTLTANSENAVSYQWSNGQTDESIIVSNAGTYTVTATDIDGCSNAVITQVTVEQSPIADIVGIGSLIFCNNDSLELNDTTLSVGLENNIHYQWQQNGIDISSQTSPTLYANSTGIYQLIEINTLNTCSDTSNTLSLTALPAPNVLINAPDTVLCPNESLVLSLNDWDISEYVWYKNGNEIANTPTINVTEPGTYYCNLTNIHNCSSLTLPINVVSVAAPTAIFEYDIINNNILNLNNMSVGAANYTWYFGNGDTSNQVSPNYTYPQGGFWNVTLIAESEYACRDTLTELIYIEPSAYHTPLASAHQVTIYPNPTTEAFIVNVPLVQTADIHIDIYDSVGRLFYSQLFENLTTGIQALPIKANLPEGLYLIGITIADNLQNSSNLNNGIRHNERLPYDYQSKIIVIDANLGLKGYF